MFVPRTLTRELNIVLHVIFGVGALASGLIAIVSSKGGWVHVRSGRIFLYSYGIVVMTALLGILFFNFRSFLLVVTILSFYDVFAGYRALQLRGRRPQVRDQVASIGGLLTPVLFISAMRYLHQPWSPILTWSILGGLLLASGYDMLRNVLPAAYLRRTWVQEHLVKMMGAYIAVTSAAAGTLFPGALPWSAVLPSALGEAVAIGFLLVGPAAWRRSQTRRASSAKEGDAGVALATDGAIPSGR